MAESIGNLYAKLGLDVKGFEAGIASAKQLTGTLKNTLNAVASSLGGGIGGALTSAIFSPTTALATTLPQAVNGFFALADSALAAERQAAKVGLQTETMLQLGKAARLAGSDMESAVRGAGMLRRNIGEALSGGTDALSMKSLGLDPTALAGMSSDEQLRKVAATMAEIGNASERAAFAQKLFGRASLEMMPILERLAELQSAGNEMEWAERAIASKRLASAGLGKEQISKNLEVNVTQGVAGWLVLFDVLGEASKAGQAKTKAGGFLDMLKEPLAPFLHFSEGIDAVGRNLADQANKEAEKRRKDSEALGLATQHQLVAQKTESVEAALKSLATQGMDFYEKALFDLDGQMKSLTISTAEWRAKIAELPAAMEAAADRADVKKAGSIIDSLRQQLDQFDSTGRRVDPIKKALGDIASLLGTDTAGFAQASGLARMLKDREDLNKMQGRADQIREGVRTPLEILNQGLAELAQLRDRGLISDEIAGRRQKQLQDQFDAATKGPKIGPAGLALSGSQEAYRAIAESRMGGVKVDKQIQLAEQGNQILGRIEKNVAAEKGTLVEIASLPN